MLKISVISDSLSMPRVTDTGTILWENTWPFLLEEKLFDIFGEKIVIINGGKRSRTIDTLIGSDFYEYIELVEPEWLIIQIGVVDAAPRIISRREQKLFRQKLFPSFLKKQIFSYRSRNRVNIVRKNPLRKVYTKPDQFKKILFEFKKKLESLRYPIKNVIFLPIIADFQKMELKSPGYKTNMQLYNNIITEYCNQVGATTINELDLVFKDKNLFCRDGYHLDIEGHKLLSEILLNVIHT